MNDWLDILGLSLVVFMLMVFIAIVLVMSDTYQVQQQEIIQCESLLGQAIVNREGKLLVCIDPNAVIQLD